VTVVTTPLAARGLGQIVPRPEIENWINFLIKTTSKLERIHALRVNNIHNSTIFEYIKSAAHKHTPNAPTSNEGELMSDKGVTIFYDAHFYLDY
jgi:hypothetical protein